MPTIQHTAAVDLLFQSPSTGKNTTFGPGDVIPDNVIEEWPANSLNTQVKAGNIKREAVASKSRGKPEPSADTSPADVSVADVRKGISDGLWTAGEAVAAEMQKPEDKQRKTILALIEDDEDASDDEGDDE